MIKRINLAHLCKNTGKVFVITVASAQDVLMKVFI